MVVLRNINQPSCADVMKAVLQFLVIVILFFGTWLLLSRINFTERLHTDRIGSYNEKKIGQLIWDAIKKSEKEIRNEKVTRPVQQVLERLKVETKESDSSDPISIHVILKGDANAFALPGRRVIIFSGLVKYCNSPDELAGVLAHEIAHIEKQHVKLKLIKEAGLAMLATLVGGSAGPEIILEMARLLSSRAYDRNLESEADEAALHYLVNAGIDPRPFANFLFRIAGQTDMPDGFEWVSTHPDSRDRAARFLSLAGKYDKKWTPSLDGTAWIEMKSYMEEL